MNRSMIITAAALGTVLATVAAAPAATSAPTAVRAPYVDTRVRDCAVEGSGCRGPSLAQARVLGPWGGVGVRVP